CPCPAPRRACPCSCRCTPAGRARRFAARRPRGRSPRCTSPGAGRREEGRRPRTRPARRGCGSAWRVMLRDARGSPDDNAAGDERAVGELWAAARDRLPEPREDRPGQPVYTLTEPPPPGETGLRAATLFDLEQLVPVCAAAHAEELGVDPLERDREGFRWRTR